MSKKFYKGSTELVILIIVSVIVFGGLAFLFRDKIFDSFNKGASSNAPNVKVILAEDLTESLVIGTQGGNLSSTDEFGNDVSIQFAQNSVLTPSSVTAEPISQIEGLPAGSQFVTGIHVSSEDILLVSPAYITFSIPSDIDTTKLRGFSYREDGDDFHLYPISFSGDSVLMEVSHFSGYGLIQVSESFVEPESPSNIESQAKQNISRIVLDVQRAQALGEREDFSEDELNRIKNILTVWYKTHVKKVLQDYVSNDELLLSSIKDFFSWLQVVQSFGFEDYFNAEITEAYGLISKAINNAINKSYTKCKDENDPSQASKLIKIAALVQTLDARVIAGISDEDITQKARNCANFKLTIDTQITADPHLDGCPGDTEDYFGEAYITMADDFSLSGEGSVDGTASVCAQECRVTGGTLEMPFEILTTQFKGSKNGEKVSLVLRFTDEEVYNELDCSITLPNGADLGLHHTNFFGWDLFLDSANVKMINPTTYEFINWEVVREDNVFARWTVDRKVPGGGAYPDYEKTILELIHLPK